MRWNTEKYMRAVEGAFLFIVLALTISTLININQLASENRKSIEEHRDSVEGSSRAAEAQIKKESKANQARADVGLCIFSVSPTRRTPEYVKSCYDLIEGQYGIKVQRFGDGV